MEPTSKIGLGFGLAMQDSMIGTPYYYFAAYGLAGQVIELDRAVSLTQGRWIREDHWKGAVLELPKANWESLSCFIREVASWYLNQP